MSKSNTTQKLIALMLALMVIMSVASISTAVEPGVPPMDASGEITQVEALGEDIAQQYVATGTDWADLALPEQLSATVNAEELSIHVVWQSTPEYDGGLAGTYLLAPVLQEGYTLAEGVTLPGITVTVEEPMLPMLAALADGASSHVGDVALFPYNFAPRSWKAANGDSLAKAGNESLFGLLETKFGGDGVTSFNLPSLGNHAPHSSLRYHVAVGETAGREPVISEVRLFPYDAEAAMPSVWRRCDGRLLGIDASEANDRLFQFIGITYGGDGGSTFALPDLRALEPEGMGYYICLPDDPNILIEDALIGEMILIAGNPHGTRMEESIVPCDGRLLPVSTNQALFSLLATTFGGDGRYDFAIPNTCEDSAGASPTLMNPLPGLQYYIVTSPSATFPNP
ncbi:MAG: tail fiber protein [Candidatus Pelethousia sp.]|nr:tail fiber protein [Candidatus Pelethousia sp.]